MATVRDLIKLFNSGIDDDNGPINSRSSNAAVTVNLQPPKSSVIGDVDSDDDKPRENPFENKTQTVFANKPIVRVPIVSAIITKVTEKKISLKPQPVNKSGVIWDISSDDEKETQKEKIDSNPKAVKVIEGKLNLHDNNQSSEQKKISSRKIVIGDDSSDDAKQDPNN